eukprot:6466219-Amphidinium_carterae.5
MAKNGEQMEKQMERRGVGGVLRSRVSSHHFLVVCMVPTYEKSVSYLQSAAFCHAVSVWINSISWWFGSAIMKPCQPGVSLSAEDLGHVEILAVVCPHYMTHLCAKLKSVTTLTVLGGKRLVVVHMIAIMRFAGPVAVCESWQASVAVMKRQHPDWTRRDTCWLGEQKFPPQTFRWPAIITRPIRK